MLFNELKKHLKSSDFAPAYLVTGEDAFLMQSAISQFRALSGSMPDFNLSEMNNPESCDAIIESCECLPLASNLRVVMVYGYGKIDLSKIGKYLDNPCPTTVLVFVSEKPENNISKLLARLTIVDCSKLDRRTVTQWIAVKTKEYGASITGSAADLLIEYCAGDMSRVSAELGKLCSYRYGGVINDDDVMQLVSPTLDFKVFALSEAVSAKNAGKASVVLKNLSESGVSPVMLIGMLYAHFRRLLYVSVTPAYDRMAIDLGVKDYAVKKAKEQSARFTPVKLKKICDSLQRADYDIKSGKITDKNALELSVFEALTV